MLQWEKQELILFKMPHTYFSIIWFSCVNMALYLGQTKLIHISVFFFKIKVQNCTMYLQFFKKNYIIRNSSLHRMFLEKGNCVFFSTKSMFLCILSHIFLSNWSKAKVSNWSKGMECCICFFNLQDFKVYSFLLVRWINYRQWRDSFCFSTIRGSSWIYFFDENT